MRTMTTSSVSFKGAKKKMGRVTTQIELTNIRDERRKIQLTALVDTGATMLSIPEEDIKKLGLKIIRQATSKYADGRKEIRNIYGGATLKVLNRVCTVDVLAGHAGQPALLGQIPLEGLDLIVDPRRQLLTTNPESPDMPMVEVY